MVLHKVGSGEQDCWEKRAPGTHTQTHQGRRQQIRRWGYDFLFLPFRQPHLEEVCPSSLVISVISFQIFHVSPRLDRHYLDPRGSPINWVGVPYAQKGPHVRKNKKSRFRVTLLPLALEYHLSEAIISRKLFCHIDTTIADM